MPPVWISGPSLPAISPPPMLKVTAMSLHQRVRKRKRPALYTHTSRSAKLLQRGMYRDASWGISNGVLAEAGQEQCELLVIA